MLAFAIYIFTDRIPVWADNLLCIGRCCSYWLVYNRLHLFFVGSDRNPVRLNLSQWRLEHMEHYGTLALRGGHEEFLSFTLIHFECAKSRIKNPFQSAELLGIPVFDHYCSCSERVQRADCLGRRSQGIREHLFFPTLTCGVFVFSAVSAPSPPALPPVHTHTSLTHTSHTHTYTHSHPVLPHTHHTHTHTSLTHTSHTHTYTHSHTPHTYVTHTYITHTHIHTHTLTHTHLTHTSLTHTSHTQTHTHNHTYNHTHTLSHTHTHTDHSHIHHMVSAALPVAFAWQVRHLVLCKGSDGFCVAGAGQCALPGVGSTPWRPLTAVLRVAFAWQVRHLVVLERVRCTPWGPLVSAAIRGVGQCALPGVGRTPWRPLVSAALPVAFAWQVRRKGSDVRPGVHWSPPLCRWLLRGRCGTCCTARGRTYALASLGLRRSAGRVCVASAAQGVGCTPWRPLVSAAVPVAFAWQVRHLLHCQGSDVRPGVPWSPPLCRSRLRGKCGARGRMYALASLGLRRSAGCFCVAGAALGALQGVGCTPWRPLVFAALPVSFAWQAWDNVLCQGSDVRPGVPWSPPLCRWLLRGRCGTWCSAKGSDVRPGVPWSPPLCRSLLRGRCGAWCSARGRMYALASLGLRRSAGGFCVAGAALGALPRGRMYALASLGLRRSAGGFA